MPYACWIAAAATSAHGTTRQRRLGSRPSGKYSSTSGMATSSHQALSSNSTTTLRSSGTASGRSRATVSYAGRAPRNTMIAPAQASSGPIGFRGTRQAITTPRPPMASPAPAAMRELGQHTAARPVDGEQPADTDREGHGQADQQRGGPSLRAHGVTVGPPERKKIRAGT